MSKTEVKTKSEEQGERFEYVRLVMADVYEVAIEHLQHAHLLEKAENKPIEYIRKCIAELKEAAACNAQRNRLKVFIDSRDYLRPSVIEDVEGLQIQIDGRSDVEITSIMEAFIRFSAKLRAMLAGTWKGDDVPF